MSPLIRLAARSAFMGSVGGVAILQHALPGISLDDVLEAVFVSYVAALTYSGFAPYTGLEPRIGVKPSAKS